jgi:hypothetical protein
MGTQSTPIVLDRRDVSRIIFIVIGLTILAGALVSPWWTRGVNLNSVGDNADANRPPGLEGSYLNYAPFRTPGEVVGFTTDASRATAVAVLGIGLVATAAFAILQVGSRVAMRAGWVEDNHDVLVRFGIIAFITGTFSVLWGALFLPLMGSNPGMMWGTEYGGQLFGNGGVLTVTRYANAGFFLGIVGAMGLPAYLWVDAAHERSFSLFTQAHAAQQAETGGFAA